MEEKGLLRHVGNLAAQRLLRTGAHILAIHKDLPSLDIVEAQQELRERRLAGA